MEKERLRERTGLASKKQPEERVLERENGRGEKPGPAEEVEVSSAKAGRAPGRHYLLTSSSYSLSLSPFPSVCSLRGPFPSRARCPRCPNRSPFRLCLASCSDRALPGLWRRVRLGPRLRRAVSAALLAARRAM